MCSDYIFHVFFGVSVSWVDLIDPGEAEQVEDLGKDIVCFILVLGVIEGILDDSVVDLYVVNCYGVLSLHDCFK